MSEAIKNRYDFVFFFDVKDGNPNGDPDQVNLPRIDTEDQRGLVTDVCIKRKVRNFVSLKKSKEVDGKTVHEDRFDIFIRQRDITADDSYLNAIIGKAQGDTTTEKRHRLCDDFWDIRTFGAVLSTGESENADSGDATDDGAAPKKTAKKKVKGGGTVRGPVQLTFARSEDRIYQAEHSITRCCVTTEKERDKQLSNDREFASTFGRKSTVPYAMYRMHGFVSTIDAQKTGFSEDDLKLLWESLINAFEHDRAAARGEMNPRKLVIFKHSSHLGNELSGRLFERVTVKKNSDLPRCKDDYLIEVNKEQLPSGIDVRVWPEEAVY